jgi:hypothetical protein
MKGFRRPTPSLQIHGCCADRMNSPRGFRSTRKLGAEWTVLTTKELRRRQLNEYAGRRDTNRE